MDILKNFVYAGVGLASNTAEKVKETIDELVEKGKITDTEGRKIVDDFFKNTEEKREDFESKLKKVQKDVTSKFDFLKKEAEDLSAVDSLKSRIEELEAKLKEAEAAAKKQTAAAKKTATATAKKATATVKKATTRKPAAKKTTTRKPAAKTTK